MMETRVMKVMVAEKGANIFDLGVMFVEIDDESGGEFVKVSQNVDSGTGEITIEPNEWPALKRAIEDMLERCKVE